MRTSPGLIAREREVILAGLGVAVPAKKYLRAKALRTCRTTGDRNHHVLGSVVALVEAMNLGTRQRRNGFVGSCDRAAQRRIAPSLVGKKIVHEVIGVVVVHGDLIEDDIAFSLDVLGCDQ